jgi:transposase-like protein
MIELRRPNFVFRIVCSSLRSASSACIAQHLITPLLGLSAALLTVCKEKVDEESLAHAVDTSARAERAKDGRAMKIVFERGGNATARWMQRYNAVKEKDIGSF